MASSIVEASVLKWTEEQFKRLNELGASSEIFEKVFANPGERNQAFQKQAKELTSKARFALDDVFEKNPKPAALEIADKLAAALRRIGFLQVETPVIMARQRLVKMGLEDDPLFAEQVFWLDSKRCLRPMLAPHLYELMLDLVKLRPKPFGLFEIGPCFRKESQGARHANEFSMLNLVEVGTPLEQRSQRLDELIRLLMQEIELQGWQKSVEESTVYGETVDVLNKDGLELASGSMGPHKLDEAWGFTETWVGLGFGLERLTMTLKGMDQLSKVGRNLSYLYGLPLKL